jgi:ribosomal protein S18 acetylase RimI-like enzyme
MDVSMRLAKKSDIKDYTNLLQKTYQAAYTNDKIGLTKDCFSKKIFTTKDTQEYLLSNLAVNKKQKTWLSFLGKELAGTLTITDKGNECELKGFYVKTELQGQGIGKKLWMRALKFAKGRDITLDIYAHNKKTIGIYKKWGFSIDKKKGVFYRHWPEWPDELKAKSIYMRYKSKS